jgi:hypothetical protein
MLLRNHPLTSCRGVPSWPPKWTWVGGLENKHHKAKSGLSKRYNRPTFCLLIDVFYTLIRRDRHISAAFCSLITRSALK